VRRTFSSFAQSNGPMLNFKLPIMAYPLAPEAIGITADTAIVGIGTGMTFAGTGTDRFAIIGIAATGAHQQPLQQILGAALTLAGATTVLRQLLLDGVKEGVIDQRGHRNGQPVGSRLRVDGVSAAGLQRTVPLRPSICQI